jgi:hypothetical protein
MYGTIKPNNQEIYIYYRVAQRNQDILEIWHKKAYIFLISSNIKILK